MPEPGVADPVPSEFGEFGEDTAYFRRAPSAGPEELVPTPVASSGWGVDHMRGAAVTGALARSAETAGSARPDLRPARFTADLHRAATAATLTTRSIVLRESGRLLLVDSEARQDGRVVARARTLFMPVSGQADDGPLWSSGRTPEPPPADLRPLTTEGRLFYSEGRGWGADAREHGNAERKQVWCTRTDLVDGEQVSPFQAAACVSDLANLAGHWGHGGVRYINADVTLVLARHPDGPGMGVSAAGRIGADALSVASAEMFDRRGVFGYTTVATLWQPNRSVDTVTHLMR